jgi:magnesium-transporting ATPase (P-type)
VPERQKLNSIDEVKQDRYDLMKVILLCHTIVVSGAQNDVQYEGTSPDEEALLKGVRKDGYTLLKRADKLVSISTPGQLL